MPASAFAHELAALIDLQPEAQLLLDAEGTLLRANAAAARLFGIPALALRGLRLSALLDGEAPAAEALLHQGRRSSQPAPVRVTLKPLPGEDAPRRLNGLTAHLTGADANQHRIWLRLSAHEAGVQRFVALNQRLELSAREIARRQRVEDQLRAQRGWLEVVLRSIGDAVVACDLQARVVFLNPVAEKVTGWSAPEALGRPIDEVIRLIDGPSGEPTPNPLHAVLRERRAFTLALQTQLLARDGHLMPIDDAATPILDDEGRLHGAVLIFRDIEPRMRAERERAVLTEQLREVQKMEAIGRLAGGIAHDFNNVVAAILANAAMIRDGLAGNDDLLPLLRNVMSAGHRARDLVQQILAFSRRQPRRLRVRALQPVIDEAVALLRGTLPARVQMVARLPAEPLRARIDATPFVQVLLNLCTNAWQAMRGSSGEIEITLEEVCIDEGHVPDGLAPGFGPWPPGHYARLSVRDNGAGMDEATMARAFEPFFTTKPPGEGTGLGLSVVHGIVAEHGGRMTLMSRLGEGATFAIYLPLEPEAGDTTPAALDMALEPAAQVASGTVVAYVDDDEIMRLTIEALLQRAGYTVLAFAGGAAALRALQDGLLQCDVLVTDYNMPQISGLDLAHAVREVRPELPIVISSGFITPALIEGAAAIPAMLMNKEESHERLLPMIGTLLEPPF